MNTNLFHGSLGRKVKKKKTVSTRLKVGLEVKMKVDYLSFFSLEGTMKEHVSLLLYS